MQISPNNIKTNNIIKNNSKPPKNSVFYKITGELESNIMLSRAIMTLVGIDIPWIIKSNNKQEREERIRRYSYFFAMAYLTPFALLPVLNRATMKYGVKLTNKFWSNNHKAMHLSNDFLKNTDSLKSGLKTLEKHVDLNPLEALYSKLTKNKIPDTLDTKELLNNSQNNYEVLRKKIIKAKSIVLFTDFLISGVSLGSLGFINNYLTKKKTGQSGYSAEFNMAKKEVIEKRADNYERNKYKRLATFAAIALGVSLSLPYLIRRGLLKKEGNVFGDYIKRNANKFDYKKGIYMNRLPFLTAIAMTHCGVWLATRNKTELKDNMTRSFVIDFAFFGGDLILASIFSRLSDNLIGTKLQEKNNTGNKNSKIKILPQPKKLTEILEEIHNKKISPLNKKISAGIFWVNLAILSWLIGFGVPKVINKMIRKDVQKDAMKDNTSSKNIALQSINMKKYFKNFPKNS